MSAVLELEDKLTAILEERGKPATDVARKFIVLELYRLGDISGGMAAEFLEMDRLEFIRYSGELGIPYFRYSKEEWDQEMQSVERLTQQLRSRTPPP